MEERLTIKFEARRKRGFGLLEAVFAASLLALLVSTIVGAIIYASESAASAGINMRGVLLAEEGISAVRNIRDGGFSNISPGTYGLSSDGGAWSLVPAPEVIGVFSRQITISLLAENRARITSSVNWVGARRPGGISLTTILTNWKPF